MKKSTLRLFTSHILLLLISLSTFATIARSTSELNVALIESNLVGQARMTYLFWDVYDARLYAAEAKWQADKPFALELHYLRSLDGKAIAQRSIEEIRKQGFNDEAVLARWYQKLNTILPDVKKGTRLTGVVDENRSTRFYLNGELLAQVDDPLFSTWFFNIWLSAATSEPKLRSQLLGGQS